MSFPSTTRSIALLRICITAFLLYFIPSVAKAQLTGAERLVVTIADDWDSTAGTLYLFEKSGPVWIRRLDGIPVMFGRKGLAWGIDGEGIPADDLHKKEGDDRSPAGIFSFGELYGLDSTAPPGVRYPYRHITAHTRCIDDVFSRYYNTIVENDSVEQDWNSAENMPRVDPDYKYVLVVEHNSSAVPGDGSCIFFHINRCPTSGCTSMDESSMLTLLRWLDPTRTTKLVQLPLQEYLRLQRQWHLPPLDLNQ